MFFKKEPTPKSIKHLESINLPDGFQLFRYGISNLDGTQTFNPPINPEHVSFTTSERLETQHNSIQVEMKKLSTVMEENNHQVIDVLKMDIESSEYAVIDEICKRGINIRQLLIEFHHHFDNISVRKTKLAIKKLNQAGYQVFNISPNGHEISLIKI